MHVLAGGQHAQMLGRKGRTHSACKVRILEQRVLLDGVVLVANGSHVHGAGGQYPLREAEIEDDGCGPIFLVWSPCARFVEGAGE